MKSHTIKINDVNDIGEILPLLSETALQEVRTFVAYLADRERRHNALVKRVRKTEKKPESIICNSVEEAMQAILNTPDEDDEA